MKNLTKHLGDPRHTPQSQPIAGRTDMERNAAGGYAFRADDWERLDRFLILGTEGGTYYANERNLTRDNAEVVMRCLHQDFARTLHRVSEVSRDGLAPKNDTAILALALSFTLPSDPNLARRTALHQVCRTGTHLFQFLQAVRGLRGGGRALNGAVREWLAFRDTDSLAFQMVKYPSRAGWTWRDVLRRYRPKPAEDDAARCALYAWAVGKEHNPEVLPEIVQHKQTAHRLLVQSHDKDALARHVEATRLPWEAVPSEVTSDRKVLGALCKNMPMMATVRQLSKLQANGVLDDHKDMVLARLRNEEAIQKSRIHPVSHLLAASAYEVGQGRHLTWSPDSDVVDALDDAFQIALKNAEPTGKKILVAVDCSGSMYHSHMDNGMPLFKIAGAMSLTYVRSDSAKVIGFASLYGGSLAVGPIAMSKRMRVTDAVRAITTCGVGGGTDCSLPFKYALDHDLFVDCFVVFTDNETWAGDSHPAQMLAAYRKKINPKAKVVWCAMTPGHSSLRLPEDPLCLGIAGFDSSAPQLVSNFVRGSF